MSEASEEGRRGFLERRVAGKKKAKFMWFELCGSSLHAYGDANTAEAAATYELAGGAVEEAADGKGRPALEVRGGDGALLLTLLATSRAEADGWRAALGAALGLEARAAPQRDVAKRSRGSIGMRATKTVSGKLITSGLGKSAVRTAVNEETKLLLVALKKIITRVEGARAAEETEDNIMRVISKAFFLEKNKKITLDDFLVADAPLRECFEVLVQMRDYRHRMKAASVEQKLRLVHEQLLRVEQVLADMLRPHLKPKSMKRLATVFGLLGSTEFLNKAWSDPDIEDERNLLADAMNRYTQFHYN